MSIVDVTSAMTSKNKTFDQKIMPKKQNQYVSEEDEVQILSESNEESIQELPIQTSMNNLGNLKGLPIIGDHGKLTNHHQIHSHNML